MFSIITASKLTQTLSLTFLNFSTTLLLRRFFTFLGTEVFKVMENALVRVGALSINEQHGMTSGSDMDHMCESERNGFDIAKQLGLASINAAFVEMKSQTQSSTKTHSSLHPLHGILSKRLYEASQTDVLLNNGFTMFLQEQDEPTTSQTPDASTARHSTFASHPTNYDKVQWELSELTDILRDKGIRDSATSTTKTSTSKLDPSTYSLVVVRDRLRAALGRQSPLSSSSFSSATDVLSLERFRESESIQGK